MTKKELTAALEPLADIRSLADFLLGLSENERETLPLNPLKKHAVKIGVDIAAGELGEILRERLEAEKTRPHFERIGNASVLPNHWIIKGIIEVGSFSMIYGDSGTYKTFFAIAMAASIGLGRDFYGHRAKRGAIYYLAAEGCAGLTRRFRGWGQENAVLFDAPIYRYTTPPDLLNAATVLLNALEDAIEMESALPLLVIIDTWHRALNGDDSDTASASAGLAVLDKIRAKFPGLAVLIIHHTGHANKDRARGASLIHAACDSEFRLEKSGGKIIFINTKNKEAGLLPPLAFKPRKVNLIADDGSDMRDEDGEIETSIVLDKVEHTPPPVVEAKGINQERVLEILSGAESKNMALNDLQKTMKERYGLRKNDTDKAVIGLENRGILCRDAGLVRHA